MRNNSESKRNTGFTLVEMLAVVAVMVILLGVSAVGVVRCRALLKITELDNAAREICMAAQNRAVQLSGARRLSALVGEDDARVVTLSGGAGGAGDAGDARVVEKSDASLAQLLPAGSIDPALYTGDFYLVYEPSSGSVTDVFYAEQDIGLMQETSFQAFYAHWSAAGRTARMKAEPMLGHYGGGLSDREDTPPLSTPQLAVLITNEERLTAQVTWWLPNQLPAAQTQLKVSAVYRGEEKQLIMAGSPSETPDSTATGTSFTYTWVLDELEGEDGGAPARFGALFSQAPGEDFTVTASLSSADGSFGTISASDADNSLFAEGSGGGTAFVKNLRHLQNLSAEWSGVEGVRDAFQQETVFCRANETYPDYPFRPIRNPQLKTYRGDSKEIRELYIPKSDGPAGLFAVADGVAFSDVYLVNAEVSAADSVKQRSAGALVGEAYGVALTNCRVYWEAGGQTNLRPLLGSDESGYLYKIRGTNAGGLIGCVLGGSVTIERSFAAATVAGTDAAGGLIGQAMGDVTIRTCYADCYITGVSAAGLIGDLSGSASVTNAYAAGFIVGDQVKRAAGLSLGAGAKVETRNFYSVMSLPKDVESWVMTQSQDIPHNDDFVNTYFQGFGAAGSDAGRQALGLSYSEMTDRGDKGGGDFIARLSGAFRWEDARTSNPYNLQQHLDLTVYSFPGLSGLPHYGDWKAEFKEPSLVYYEYHGGTEYRFSGGNARYLVNTLVQDRPVLTDGYAVAFLRSDGEGVKEVAAVCRDKDGNVVWQETKPVGGLIDTVGVDAQSNRTHYYLMTMPPEVVNGDTAVEGVYQYLTLELYFDGSLAAEGRYFYNPHFAETVIPYLPTGGETGDWTGDFAAQLLNTRGALSVRTPRHLNNLSRFPTYYSDPRLTFTQNLPLDYGTYEGFGAPYVQSPIGVWSAPFRGVYEGNCYAVKNVLFTVTEGEKGSFCAGLFGRSAGILRNIVYEMDPERDEVSVAVDRGSQTVYAGALVGINDGAVRNCAVSGVRLRGMSAARAHLYLGGLAGQNNGVIQSSAAESALVYAEASFFAENNYLGGLVGQNASTVVSSYAVGRVGALADKTSSARVCGFVGFNTGRVDSSYAAVDLRPGSMQVEAYGFCGQRLGAQANTFYLNNGNFTYREQSYAANYTREEDWAQGVPYDELVERSIAGMGWQSGEGAFPYPTGVKDAAGSPIHYGRWPTLMPLGVMGVYYWEKLGEDYYISLLAVEPGADGAPPTVTGQDTLSTVHSDGLAVTDFGYGYYAKRLENGDELALTFTAKDINYFGADKDGFDPAAAPTDQTADQALESKMNGFAFHSYPSYDPNTPGSAGLYPTGDPNGSFTLTQGKTQLTFAVNPHFAQALSVEADPGIDASKAPTQEPGAQENPYGVRSVAQLELINWNRDTRNTTTVMVGATSYGGAGIRPNILDDNPFPYLSTPWVGRSYHWEQTHDLHGGGKTFTPIAEYYDTVSSNVARLDGWFGGSYNGRDYVIENLSIQGQTASCAGLFGVVYDASLQNIVLYSSDGQGRISSGYVSDNMYSPWYSIGALAGLAATSDASRSAVRNCSVSGYTIEVHTYQMQDHVSNATWGGTCVGGLLGTSNMNLNNCTAVTDIVIKKGSDRLGNDNLRIGGLAGVCQRTMTNCYAGGKATIEDGVTVKNNNHIYVGGIVGGVYIKPLRVGGSAGREIGTANNSQMRSALSGCYSYFELPKRDQRMRALYALGGVGEINFDNMNFDQSNCTITNCFYLSGSVLVNNTREDLLGAYTARQKLCRTDIGRAEGAVKSLTYAQLSGREPVTVNGTQRENIYGFLTDYRRVTTSVLTAGGDFAVNGKYSYPPSSRGDLRGKNYPFPTILTREDTDAAGASAVRSVHYGAWPLEGIWRAKGDEPITLDVFASPSCTERLGLTESVKKGGVWTAALDEDGAQLVDMTPQEGPDGLALSLTAKALGTGRLTVTYTEPDPGRFYSLELEVSVTAELELRPSAIEVYAGEDFTLSLAPHRKLLDTEGADADTSLPQEEGFVLTGVSASGGGVSCKVTQDRYVPAGTDPNTGDELPAKAASVSLRGDTPGQYTVNVAYTYTRGGVAYDRSATVTVQVLPLPQVEQNEEGTVYTLSLGKEVTSVGAEFTCGGGPLPGEAPVPVWDGEAGVLTLTRDSWPAGVEAILTLTLDGWEHRITVPLPPKPEPGP